MKLGIGHPYTNVRGNFPQALGFAAGGPGRKRRPERLLPSLFRFVDQAVDRLEALEAPLRLAVGLRNPEAAAGATAEGSRALSCGAQIPWLPGRCDVSLRKCPPLRSSQG